MKVMSLSYYGHCYTILWLTALSAVMAQETTFAPSDMPSDVPSFVPTYSPSGSTSPSSLPTAADTAVGTGPYPPCPICPEGQVIGTPNAALASTGQTCASTNVAGLAGMIEEVRCQLLQTQGAPLCACAPMSTDESPAPTASPVANIVPSPTATTGGECSTNSCTLVPTWGQLATFVQAAADGDELCLCGRYYDDNLCTTSPITLDTNKQVTLQCASGQICSYNCPATAFVVNAGTMTLVGADMNFILTGGTAFSRVLVNSQGNFVAAQVAFQDTLALLPPSTSDSRRHLQRDNGRGAGLETYGMTTVSNSKFENCTAALEGGAVYVGSGTATFSNVEFIDNSAFQGGAIFAQGGNVNVERSTFQDNVATNTNGNADVFARAAANVEACGNTGGSEDLTGACSGAAVTQTAMIWTVLAVVGAAVAAVIV